MDISKNKSVADREEEGTVVHVKDASGELAYYSTENTGGNPVTITVVGTYSTTYRKAVSQNRDRWLKQRTKELDGEQLDKQSLETTASCIKAWDGFFDGDKPVPYSKANAVVILDSAPWIREQVEGAMGDHASFFSKPSANS